MLFLIARQLSYHCFSGIATKCFEFATVYFTCNMICYKGKRANKKFLMRRNGKLDRELLGHGLKGYGAYMGGRPIVNIGVQRFDKLRRENRFYIDKTGFIREWWETGSDVTLITRPRRFGKTLNMSMTECFFSNKYADRGDLFEGLDIWSDEKFSDNVRKMNTFMNKVALQTFHPRKRSLSGFTMASCSAWW